MPPRRLLQRLPATQNGHALRTERFFFARAIPLAPALYPATYLPLSPALYLCYFRTNFSFARLFYYFCSVGIVVWLLLQQRAEL